MWARELLSCVRGRAEEEETAPAAAATTLGDVAHYLWRDPGAARVGWCWDLDGDARVCVLCSEPAFCLLLLETGDDYCVLRASRCPGASPHRDVARSVNVWAHRWLALCGRRPHFCLRPLRWSALPSPDRLAQLWGRVGATIHRPAPPAPPPDALRVEEALRWLATGQPEATVARAVAGLRRRAREWDAALTRAEWTALLLHCPGVQAGDGWKATLLEGPPARPCGAAAPLLRVCRGARCVVAQVIRTNSDRYALRVVHDGGGPDAARLARLLNARARDAARALCFCLARALPPDLVAHALREFAGPAAWAPFC